MKLHVNYWSPEKAMLITFAKIELCPKLLYSQVLPKILKLHFICPKNNVAIEYISLDYDY